MPRKRSVKLLSQITIQTIVEWIHVTLQRISKSNIHLPQEYVQNIFEQIPCSVYSNLLEKLFTRISREKSILSEAYYNYISAIFNSNLRELHLSDSNFFQDSSSFLEEFLTPLTAPLSNCKSLKIYRNVMELLDFDPQKLTSILSSHFPCLSVLVLVGLPPEYTETQTQGFVRDLVSHSPFIQILDLSESNVNDDGAEMLGSQLRFLKTLRLNHTQLTVAGVENLLLQRDLIRFDCLKGSINLVSSVITSHFPKETLSLRHFILRSKADLDFIPQVSAKCPHLREIKLYMNESGFESSATLGALFTSLNESFEEDVVSIDLLYSFFNALQFIQLEGLHIYGPSLTKITLIQPDFLHAVCLVPIGKHCLNLKSLSLLQPNVIGDEMFFEGVPPIDYESDKYFPALEELVFEGVHFEPKIARLLLSHSRIKNLLLKLMEVPSFEALQPGAVLERINLSIKKDAFTPGEVDVFLRGFEMFMDKAPSLKEIQLYIKHRNALQKVVSMIQQNIRTKNWDVELHIY